MTAAAKRGRGRPPKAFEDRATVPLTLRLYQADAERLERLHELTGDEPSTLIRDALEAYEAELLREGES